MEGEIRSGRPLGHSPACVHFHFEVPAVVEFVALIGVGVRYSGSCLNVFGEQPEVRGLSSQPGPPARGDGAHSIKAVGTGTGSSSGQPTIQDEVSRGATCSPGSLPGQWDHQVCVRPQGDVGGRVSGVSAPVGLSWASPPCPGESSEEMLQVPRRSAPLVLPLHLGSFPLSEPRHCRVRWPRTRAQRGQPVGLRGWFLESNCL